MRAKPYPITVLFAALKSCGISNRDAAALLLSRNATIGNSPAPQVIETKSQLSRRVVHAAPGALPEGCFAPFDDSAPALAARMLEDRSVERHKGDLHAAARALISEELAAGHDNMARALAEHGRDDRSYRELLSRLERFGEQDPLPLVTLHALALAVAGCTADGRRALVAALAYAFDDLDLDEQTAETAVLVDARRKPGEPSPEYGIARVRDGVIAAGTPFHRVGEEGLVIGLLPQDEPCAIDVDFDVSRRHARLWVEDGRLFVADLGSTNGTTVISAGTNALSIAALPKNLRDQVAPQAVELHYGDYVCLGATTRYIVLPGIAPCDTQ